MVITWRSGIFRIVKDSVSYCLNCCRHYNMSFGNLIGRGYHNCENVITLPPHTVQVLDKYSVVGFVKTVFLSCYVN